MFSVGDYVEFKEGCGPYIVQDKSSPFYKKAFRIDMIKDGYCYVNIEETKYKYTYFPHYLVPASSLKKSNDRIIKKEYTKFSWGTK